MEAKPGIIFVQTLKHFQALPPRIFQKQNIILITFSERPKQFEIYFKLKVYLCFKRIRISTLEFYQHRCWGGQ